MHTCCSATRLTFLILFSTELLSKESPWTLTYVHACAHICKFHYISNTIHVSISPYYLACLNYECFRTYAHMPILYSVKGCLRLHNLCITEMPFSVSPSYFLLLQNFPLPCPHTRRGLTTFNKIHEYICHHVDTRGHNININYWQVPAI